MRQPGLWRARMAAGLATVALGAALAVSLPAPAGAAPSPDESRMLTMANALRASLGVPALTLDDSLSGVARAWAGTMAAAGTISHNPSLTTEVTGWMKLSENVGMGPSIDSVQSALVASHPHYVNLTDTEVTTVGIGVVTSGSTVFVVEDFLGRGAAAAPAPAPAPAAAPTTARPAPAPTTTVAPPVPATARPATAPVVAAPSPAQATAAPPASTSDAAAAEPSPWLALALEVTRGWERTPG